MPQAAGVHSFLLFAIGLGVALAGCGQDLPQRAPRVLTSDIVHVPSDVLAASRLERRPFATGTAAVLYLNFDGAEITYGRREDASTNDSFIGGGTIPPFNGDESVRDAVVQAVKELYKDFDIQIVTARPASGDYDMTMIGGTSGDIGHDSGGGGGVITGVAPLDCGNELSRSISFVFADSIKEYASSANYVKEVAETTAHESAHAYGLPHSADGCDIMSYSSCQQGKAFLDQDMSMQSDSYGDCNMYSMNSHQLLLTALGQVAAVGSLNGAQPHVSITSPADGATVSTQLTVEVAISGNTAVSSVELLVDGKTAGKLDKAPFTFETTVEHGAHVLTVNGYDAAGNKGSATVNVAAGAVAASPADSLVETAEPAPGSQGASCRNGTECMSGICAKLGGANAGYCTETCQPEANTCPDQIGCVQAAGDGRFVCGPPVVLYGLSSGAASAGNEGDFLIGGCTLGPSRRPVAGGALSSLLLLGLLFCRRRTRH